MADPNFEEFVHWTQHEASIEARKVSLQEIGSDQRGLFATQTVFPGERILFLPATSLIGSEMLQTAGQQVIASLSAETKSGDSDESAKEWERRVMGAIEELRQLLTGDDDNKSAVKQEANGLGYLFRGDDAVALYLIACRHILQFFNCHQEPYEAPLGPQEPDEAPLDPQESTMSSPPPPPPPPRTHSLPVVASDITLPQPPLIDALPIAQDDRDDNDNDPEQSIDDDVLEPVTLVEVPPSSVETPENENENESENENENEIEIEGPSLPQPQCFPSFLPQVAVMPKSFPTSPLSYNETELARIEGTNCHGYTTRMLQQIQSDWQQLHAVLQTFGSLSRTLPEGMSLVDIVTLESYQWALQNIYSRSTDFQMTVAADSAPEQHRRRVIAPLFDMMNHDFASEIYHAMDTNGNISVFNGSSRSMEAGEEICLCYGNFPSEKFMYIYGFAIMDNPFDAVSIYAPIPPTDLLHQVKARILETKCGIVDTNEPHALLASRRNQGQPIIPSSLLSVLRIVGIQSAEDVLAVAAQETTDEMCIGMISIENERGAVSALQQALYSMARMLALNLISDDTIEKGASFDESPSSGGNDTEQQQGNDGSRSPDLPTPKQARALVQAENRLQDPNFRNAKILCQSEYLILQTALTELAERLAALDGTMPVQQ
jgi:hypothetical protein